MFILLLLITNVLGTTAIPIPNDTPGEWRPQTFQTLKDCEDRRILLREEFDKAYAPEERDYEFVCALVRKDADL